MLAGVKRGTTSSVDVTGDRIAVFAGVGENREAAISGACIGV